MFIHQDISSLHILHSTLYFRNLWLLGLFDQEISSHWWKAIMVNNNRGQNDSRAMDKTQSYLGFPWPTPWMARHFVYWFTNEEFNSKLNSGCKYGHITFPALSLRLHVWCKSGRYTTFFDKGGRRELFRYDIMDICLGKKQFCLAPTGNCFKPWMIPYWVHKIIMILWKNTDMSCYKRDKSAILRTYHFDLLRQIEVRLLELESKSSFSEILPVYMFLAIHTRTLIQDLCCK